VVLSSLLHPFIRLLFYGMIFSGIFYLVSGLRKLKS